MLMNKEVKNMKHSISVTLDGKITTKEFHTRSLDVIGMHQKCKSTTFKPKKGKGSFKRMKRVPLDF